MILQQKPAADRIRRSGRKMALVIASLALVAPLVASCGARQEASSGDSANSWKAPAAVTDALKAEGTVEIIDHNISSSSVQAQLYAAVVKAAGGDVKINNLSDYPSTWSALARSKDTVVPEMWTSSYPEQFEKYVKQDKTVDAFEPNDVQGEEGWYVPTYVIKGDEKRGIKPTCPGLSTWEQLNDCAKIFATGETGDKGRYLSGAASWGPAYGDPQRIENLGLNYEVKYAGSEAALQAEWARAYERGEPILGLMWTPHYVTAKYDLTRIKFPAYTPECWTSTYACDWGPQDIWKLTSKDFGKTHDAAAKILGNYNLSTEQLGAMMTRMTDEGMKADDVVADWMEKNPSIWQAWVNGDS